MANEIVVRETRLTRFLSWVRALSVIKRPTEFNAGPRFGTDTAVLPPDDPLPLMAALGAFGWVYTSVNICSRDLAMIPRKVMRGEGKNAKVVENHPFTKLMRQPRTKVSGVVYSRQRWADWYLSGMSYDLILQAGSAVSLQRLHPANTEIVTDTAGDIRAVKYNADGLIVHYDWEDLVVMRGISWETGPEGSYGVSAIKALWHELNGEHVAIMNNTRTAKRGQPSFIISPRDTITEWDEHQTSELQAAFNAALTKLSGGAIVVGGASQIEALGFSPREMEFAALREMTRDNILAAFSIPQSKAGVPSANYASARQEDVNYWEARMADAELRDSADSRLAQRLSGNSDDRVVSDFSRIQALQYNRSERQQRSQTWWLMGLPLPVALAAEGFEDLAQEAARVAPEPDPDPEPEPDDPEDRPLDEDEDSETTRPDRSLARIMRTRALTSIPVTERERSELWRQFEADVRLPAERQFTLGMERILRSQANRYARRLDDAVTRSQKQTRILDVDFAALLLSAFELQTVSEDAEPLFERVIREGIANTGDQLGLRLSVPARLELADIVAAQMAANIQRTTEDFVRSIVRRGIDEAKTVTDIATDIRSAAGFSPSRALQIARTETTKTLNIATQAAYDQAADDHGVEVRVQWLSARDANVRATHTQLDGDIIPRGGYFEVDGKRARGPGQFNETGENINCFVASTVVRGTFGAGVRSQYEGPIFEITTKSGRRVEVTPNHPILTDAGFVPAYALQQGSQLVTCTDEVWSRVPHRDNDRGPASIEQIFRSLNEWFKSSTSHLRPEDLHGDARSVHGYVDVVLAHRQLLRQIEPLSTQPHCNVNLEFPDMTESSLARLRTIDQLTHAHHPPPSGIMRSLDLSGSLLGGHVGPLQGFSFGATPDLDASLIETAGDNGSRDAQSVGAFFAANPGQVEIDQVINIQVDSRRCHVYDLQSVTGLVLAQGIYSSNCRCTTIPIVEG